MVEQTQTDSTASENYLGYVFEVMRSNELFLRENARDLFDEIVELTNDAIDYVKNVLDRRMDGEEYIRYSMHYFLNHILIPISNAILIESLTGNLPTCFIQIRSVLESFVKCYLADIKYPDQDFFQERLNLLEEENVSISKRMNELDDYFGLEKDFISMWGKLSERWVHARGVMNKLVNQIIEKSNVPSWALVIPMNYTKNDLNTLNELCEHLTKFRNLLKMVMKNYY